MSVRLVRNSRWSDILYNSPAPFLVIIEFDFINRKVVFDPVATSINCVVFSYVRVRLAAC
jgi:hypothetical protein